MTLALAPAARGQGGGDPPGGLHSLRNVRDQFRGTKGMVLHSLEISAPPPKGASAGVFSVAYRDIFADERGGPGVITVTAGGRTTTISEAPRARRRFVVPAGDEIQHWQLDGQELLIHVRPKEEIVFIADPCARWDLLFKNLGERRPVHVDSVCRADDARCPPGFGESTESPGVDDSRCKQLEAGSKKAKICIRQGSLSMRARVRAVVYLGNPAAVEDSDNESVVIEPDRPVAPIPLLYERCRRPKIEIGGHQALLVIDSGESWTMDIDAKGEIRGRFTPLR